MNFRTQRTLTRSLSSLAFLTLVAGAMAQDEAIYWNQQALQAIKTAGGAGAPPPKSSRSLAMVSVAVFDAVNSTSGLYSPYHYGASAPSGTSADAAACQAAYDVLSSLYPSQNFSSQLASRMNSMADGPAKTQGIALGHSVATDILSYRSADGSTNNTTFTGGTGIGEWRPTTPGTTGLLPLWGQVTPFAMTSGSQFRQGPPPAVGSAEYANAYNEVVTLGRATGSSRTTDQTNIALFWADGGGTVTPPGHWNRIAQGLGSASGQSLIQNARMFALLNIAEADAAIAAWDMKYLYNFWRPVTAIQNGDVDGNALTTGDASWSPLITTPPFPTFTSGHSTFSAAAGEVLAQFFGTDNLSFTTSTDAAGIADRSFTSLSQAVDEAGMSRIYGGIHFQFDNTVGKSMGRSIGGWAYNHYMTAVPEPSVMITLGLGSTILLFRRRRKG